MRFTFTPDQREFFRKHRYIEFEGILSPQQAELLDQKAQALLKKRAPLSSDALSLYKAGYDLWREEETIKKGTQKLSIAHIASELFDTSPLRIAFDQYCVAGSLAPPFTRALSLLEISSIKPLAGGILFLLKENAHEISGFPLPKKAGNALFFTADFSLPWNEFYSLKELSFLLVAFAPLKSYYRPEPNDPHSPIFKKFGYVYNEQLKEELHPVVFGKN